MKYFVFIFWIFFTPLSLNGKAVMPRINATLFINEGLTDFSTLFKFIDPKLKNKVQVLFENDKLDHVDSKAYDLEATFDKYWEKQSRFWYSLDINLDGENELLYLSEFTEEIEMESFEIYILKNNIYTAILREVGHLIAYKIHPNTKEIVLYHHRYPCCASVSHNINMVRLINNKIVLRKKYVVARDIGMKGDFFPKHVKFSSKMIELKKEVIIRWSPSVISKNASESFQNNIVGKYEKGTQFRVLCHKGSWKYVLMCDKPMKRDSNSGIIDTDNFYDVKVFGWMKN